MQWIRNSRRWCQQRRPPEVGARVGVRVEARANKPKTKLHVCIYSSDIPSTHRKLTQHNAHWLHGVTQASNMPQLSVVHHCSVRGWSVHRLRVGSGTGGEGGGAGGQEYTERGISHSAFWSVVHASTFDQ